MRTSMAGKKVALLEVEMSTNEISELPSRPDVSITESGVNAADLVALVDSVKALQKELASSNCLRQGRQLSEFLSREELRDLTGLVQAAKQATWLRDQCIAHRLVGARVIVSREHVRSWLSGRNIPKSNGLNWAALGG